MSKPVSATRGSSLRWALVLMLSPGCATWLDQEPACTFNAYDWSDDLLANIMSGDGDGTFDLDPEDTPRSGVVGSYNVNTGDYDWSISYAKQYFLKAGEVAGYGTAYHNGNLDILQTSTFTDSLGDAYVVNERTLRKGCGMTTETWTADDQSDLVTQSGKYTSDSEYVWSGDIAGYTWTGSRHANLSHTETITADDGTYYSQQTTKPEGIVEGDLEYSDSGADYAGTTLRRFDGGQEFTLTMSEGGQQSATIVGDYDYGGAGSETYTYPDGSTCTANVTSSGGCTYTCSDGSSGGC